MGVDNVAAPITQTAAVRTPAISSGMASGNSTRQSRCQSVMPTPRAASTSAGSMLRMPATPLRIIGSIEYSASASSDGRKPSAENPVPNEAFGEAGDGKQQRIEEREQREARHGLDQAREREHGPAHALAANRGDDQREAHGMPNAMAAALSTTCWLR